MSDYISKIYELYPQTVKTVGDKAYDANDNEVIYDLNLINSELAKTAYIGKRQAEYPSFADQFDTLFHGGYDAWKAQIQAVKDKYPKE